MSYKTKSEKIGNLIKYAKNSRTHSPKQVEQIAKSITEFGFTNPIIVDDKNMVIAGHGRILAAEKLGIEDLPCVIVTGWSEAQKKAYVIADNKLALNAGWDEEMLSQELKELNADGYDIDLTGFSSSEVSGYIRCDSIEGEDDAPEPPKIPKSKLGDVWILGNHRLMCGDSTSIDAVEKLMDGQKADMVFTDPPYGISIVSKDGSLGVSPKGKYKQVLGDGDTNCARIIYEICNKIGFEFQFFWGANHYSDVFPPSSCWVVWDKQGGKSVTFADCELCYTNLEKPVRMFTHIWDGFRRSSEKGEMRVHPTQKPVQLIVDIFEKFDCPSSCVDLFGGSGSTLIACEKTDRQCYMMELDPHYIDVIINRWQNFTGEKAVHEVTGEYFG